MTFVAVPSLAVLASSAFAGDTRPSSHLLRPAIDAGPIAPIPPDPQAIYARGQWVFDLRYDKGDVFLLGVRRVELDGGQWTPRVMGRFALELFEGPALIERVRFDFPMLGASEPLDAGRNPPPSLEKRLNSRIGVLFPVTKRGTRLELWDRATNRRWPLPWPPDDAPGPGSGGPPPDGGSLGNRSNL